MCPQDGSNALAILRSSRSSSWISPQARSRIVSQRQRKGQGPIGGSARTRREPKSSAALSAKRSLGAPLLRGGRRTSPRRAYVIAVLAPGALSAGRMNFVHISRSVSVRLSIQSTNVSVPPLSARASQLRCRRRRGDGSSFVFTLERGLLGSLFWGVIPLLAEPRRG